MPANAPHGTTSKYFTCGAKSIPRITIVKAFIDNHVVAVATFAKPPYEFVASLKPFGISSKVVAMVIGLVCWK